MSESPPSATRLQRNLAEKQRRDKLNSYISELGSLVPVVATAPRKLDKTSILRLSASYLRFHQTVETPSTSSFDRWFNAVGHATQHLLDKMDAFFLAVTTSGKIIHVDARVEKILGHSQVDMLGLPIYCFVHPEDQQVVRKKLTAFNTQAAAVAGSRSQRVVSQFECRLSGRLMSRSEPTVYEKVQVSGTFRGVRRKRDWHEAAKSPATTGTAVATKTDLNGSGNGEAMFLAVVKLLHPQQQQQQLVSPLVTMVESMREEFITKHLHDGRIIQTEHRISSVTGYMIQEVTGKSAFEYIFEQDHSYTLQAQALMLSGGEGQVTYRLQPKSGKMLYLRSRGFIEYDSKQNITGFVCINSLIDESQGEKEIAQLLAMLSSMNISYEPPTLLGVKCSPVAAESSVLNKSTVMMQSPCPSPAADISSSYEENSSSPSPMLVSPAQFQAQECHAHVRTKLPSDIGSNGPASNSSLNNSFIDSDVNLASLEPSAEEDTVLDDPPYLVPSSGSDNRTSSPELQAAPSRVAAAAAATKSGSNNYCNSNVCIPSWPQSIWSQIVGGTSASAQCASAVSIRRVNTNGVVSHASMTSQGTAQCD